MRDTVKVDASAALGVEVLIRMTLIVTLRSRSLLRLPLPYRNPKVPRLYDLIHSS